MAKVRWRQPTRKEHVLPWINVPPRQTVILCSPPDQYAYIVLHCYDHGSKPCLDQAVCPECEAGDVPRVVGYAAALYMPPQGGSFTRGILCVGSSFGLLSERDQRGHRLVIERKKRQDGTWSKLTIVERLGIVPDLQRVLNVGWFDVRERLLFRYGIESEVYEGNPPKSLYDAMETKGKEDEGLILKFPSPPAA